jgi:exonuclease III
MVTLIRKLADKKLISFAAVLIVLIAGLVLLIVSKAEGPYVAAEPENGSKSGPAQTVSDTTASGGGSIKFSAPASQPARIAMVTWNVGVDNPRNVGEEVIDIMRFADIMAIQELTTGTAEMDSVRSKVICSSCAYDSTYTSHTYDNSSPNKDMLMWKKAVYDKLTTGVVDVSPRTSVENGEVVAPRFINWAKLRHKATGKILYASSQHVVSGVDSNGSPNTSVPKRLALYRTHMDKLTALITKQKADNVPVFTLGDFNVDYRRDHIVKDPMFPYVRLGAVGARSSFDVLQLAGIGPTEGTRPVSDRLIDYVWNVVRPDTVVISEDISASTHGSDHFAFYSTSEIR